MLSSKPNWLFVVVIVTASCTAFTSANSHCSDFDTWTNYWYNTGSRNWTWSKQATPSFIPDGFIASSGYVWFQDQDEPPNTATMRTPDNSITLYNEDEVSISIYRHINNFDGEYRPVLNFVSNGGTDKQGILWSFNYDVWDPIAIVCGSMDEPCCLTFPCTGYFSVDGSIMARDELLAVDNIQINDGCSGPAPTPTPTTAPPPPPPTTTSPPTPSPTTSPTPETPTLTPSPTTPPPTTTTTVPPPSSWCCTFETNDLCYWSLTTISNGWHWSEFLAPVLPIPTHTGQYIYIEDDSADVYSPDLVPIPTYSQFTIDYIFQTTNYNPAYNNAQFYFQETSTSAIIPLLTVDTSMAGWTTTTLIAPGPLCSSSAPTCYGKFHVRSANQPGNNLILAVDNFMVNGATC